MNVAVTIVAIAAAWFVVAVIVAVPAGKTLKKLGDGQQGGSDD